MKKFIAILLIGVFIIANMMAVYGATSIIFLSDLDGHWIKAYESELYLLQHLKILSGYPDGTFGPDNQITREEFVKILVTAQEPFQKSSYNINSFQDVLRDRWSFSYIEDAVDRGLILPEDYDGFFKPLEPITRLEMAVMIARAMNMPDKPFLEQATFADDDLIPLWAKPYIAYAVEMGIIYGIETAEGVFFSPQRTATRAEASIMITRLLDKKNPLKKIGFYALDSFKQLDRIGDFHEVAFGWSTLEKDSEGKVILTLSSNQSSHRMPSGYEFPLEIALTKGIERKLMITETRTELIYQLLERVDEQEDLILAILDALETHEFSGIVMDLENIRNTEKGYQDAYTAFLSDLKRALTPSGYQLTVTVQPRNVIGYFDGYDFKAIGELADEIILMAHDYHDKKTTYVLTDQAPIQKVQEALVDLLNAGVPKEKAILGLQLAGGTQLRRIEGQDTVFYTPSMTTIYQALGSREGAKGFDFLTMTPYFQYTDSNTGHNIIRYENYESLRSKMLLGKYYGIKGVSIWRLGEIQPEMHPLIQ